MSGCISGAAPTDGALSVDQVAFMVRSPGGLVLPAHYVMEAPALVIYGEDRVLTAVKPTVAQLVPTRYELARIDAVAVLGFVTAALSGGLLTGGTDFGPPSHRPRHHHDGGLGGRRAGRGAGVRPQRAEDLRQPVWVDCGRDENRSLGRPF